MIRAPLAGNMVRGQHCISTKRIGSCLVSGLVAGAAMSIPMWSGYLGSRLDGVPICGRLWHTVHLPAGYLAALWTDWLRLPPHDEAAWFVVPACGIVLQWALIGALVGLAWSWQRARRGKPGQ